MSLTSFLESNADVRAYFREHFHKPDFRVKAPILAPPLTESYGLAGTAFDYLLRFYLQKINPCAKTDGWVAESGLEKLGRFYPAMALRARRNLDAAKSELNVFLRSKNSRPSQGLIAATVKLARLDVVYRVGLIDGESLFGPIPKALMIDLEAMIAIVKPELFRAKRRCILNPTFGSGSELVGGADADIIVDDTLIDVKTTKHLTFEREMFNQVFGYYVLSCIGGVDGCRARAVVKHVGVYYARYGILHTIPVADCIAVRNLPACSRWLTKRARKFHAEVLLATRFAPKLAAR